MSLLHLRNHRPRCSRTIAILVLGITLIICEPLRLWACAMIMRPGDDAMIRDEMALIIWDAKNKTEHFIRAANMTSTAEDFGFVVPTPSLPTLHETSGHALSYLQELTAPEIRYEQTEESRFRLFAPGTGLDFFSARQEANMAIGSPAPDSAVNVLSQQQVGGYDASILRANDAEALQTWLQENGYTTSPALKEWFDIYIQQDWYFTAFKVHRLETPLVDGSTTDTAALKPVRITFQTDRPFYPYREPVTTSDPANTTTATRMLRLFVLSNQRMDGAIGDTELRPATTKWAGRLADWQVGNLINYLSSRKDSSTDLKLDSELSLLTELEDPSSPRNGTDELYLSATADQSFVSRPPIIRTKNVVVYSPDLPQWPFLLTPFALGIVGWQMWRRRGTNH